MVVFFGTEAKEIFNSALENNCNVPVSGVFEYFDMGGAMYKGFKRIGGELFVNDFGTFNEAVRYINIEVN
jgi:hypothetical protein